MSLRRIPIKGWKKNVHVAAAFDTPGEYATACVLDSSTAIEWWLRNDPAQMRVPTPVGFFEPDFVYKRAGEEPRPLRTPGDKGASFSGTVLGPVTELNLRRRALGPTPSRTPRLG